MGTTYKDSGVDIEVGNQAVRQIAGVVKSTFTPQVLTGIGLFGSLYDMSEIVKNYKEPVLVQSIDGVGTKLVVAGMMNMYDQAGADIAAHGCNDILCQGARPLTMLDYVATDKLSADTLETIVSGMARECSRVGMSLVGGETAEMPNTYAAGEWDVVGAVLGVVEKSKILNGSAIQAGDALIGLSSAGLHSNGYSLARKVFFDVKKYTVRDVMAELPSSVGTELMRPHLNYFPAIDPLLKQFDVHGIAHITGGGLVDNVPRILPVGLDAAIKRDSWEVLPIFEAIQQFGDVSDAEMYRTFNMGIGLVLVVPADQASAIQAALANNPDGIKTYAIGTIQPGKQVVCFV